MATAIPNYQPPPSVLPGQGAGGVNQTTDAAKVGGGVGTSGAIVPPTSNADGQAKVNYTPGTVALRDDEIESALDRFQTAAGQLDLSLYTDFARLLAQAMVEQIGAQRANAILQKKLEIAGVQNALLADAQKSIDAAAEIRAGALTSLIISVVVSAITIAASAVSIGATAKTAKADTAADEMSLASKQVDDGVAQGGKVDADVVTQMQDAAMKASAAAKQAHHLSDRMAAVTNGIKTLGDTVGAIGKYLQSVTDADVKVLEAEGKQLAAQAQYLQTLVDQEKAIEEALNDFMKAMMKFIADLLDARVGAFINKV
jgi:hypothetical protein